MRFHAGALRTAALVAAVFVATRVIYRVVFGGGAGGGVVLIDIPRVPLNGAFAHVTLFGPVTSGGLWNAAVSALPFAAVIIACGLLSAVVDMHKLFVRSSTRGPLRSISRSLVIAWSTAPALAHAVRRVRLAAALRGERGAAALLVPVFEQTIERALALAASMEVRGFAASNRVAAHTDDNNNPVVSLSDVRLGYENREILAAVNFALAAGSLTVLTGPTGSGKSSLLRSIDGLFEHFDGGKLSGALTICGRDRSTMLPRDTAGIVGSVAQNVRLSFASSTVRDEIGFALAVQGLPAQHIAEQVLQTAELIGVVPLLDRSCEALSAGEATLVAIAAALVARPALLLLDEPCAELDDAARMAVCGALNTLAHEHNVAVLVAEHHYEDLRPFADLWLTLCEGTVLLTQAAPIVERDTGMSTSTSTSTTTEDRPGAGGSAASTSLPDAGKQRHPIARVQQLTVSHAGREVVHAAHCELTAGEIVALSGSNGAGKSSLLVAIARADTSGSVVVNGNDVAALSPRARRRSVALIPERVDELFFQTTVAAECRRADKRDAPATPTAEAFATLLSVTNTAELNSLLLLHPRDLSAGQQLCLALAIQLAASPTLLLVDEPSRGLDPHSRALVSRALSHVTTEARAVLFATHDSEFAHGLAQRHLLLSHGALSDGALNHGALSEPRGPITSKDSAQGVVV